MSRGRLMALTLMALALPTVALANSVDFTTGTFIRGTVSRTIIGGFTRPNFNVAVVGSLDGITVSTSDLGLGCNTATTGICTFDSGTITVRNPSGVVIFTDSLDDGMITKTARGAAISATFLPNALTTTPGVVHLTISFSDTAPISDHLLGGTGIAISSGVIPEPSTMLSLGTGLIALAGVMRHKLKLTL